MGEPRPQASIPDLLLVGKKAANNPRLLSLQYNNGIVQKE